MQPRTTNREALSVPTIGNPMNDVHLLHTLKRARTPIAESRILAKSVASAALRLD
jgi:hypothetical protein